MPATARIDVETGPNSRPLGYAFTLQPGDTPKAWLANLQRRTDALARDYRGARLTVVGEAFAMAYNGDGEGFFLTPAAKLAAYPKPFLVID